MSADVIILTGPPGAGKSTTARALAQSYEASVHLHTDDFWHAIVAGGIPPYLPESDAQNQTVLSVIAAAAGTYAGGGFVTVIDGIVGPWMLDHFVPLARTGRVHYIVLRPGRTETLRRAQARTEPDALVDEQPILAMWDQFADLGRYARHILDTSGDSAAETLAAVSTAVAEDAFLLAGG